MVHKIRWKILYLMVALSVAALAFGWSQPVWLWLLVLTVPLTLLGLWDVLQRSHSVLRNHPIIGHFRFLLEDLGPELHQYIVESNTQGRPFDRDQRSVMYQRAKRVVDALPFGTELDVYRDGYTWLNHSVAPKVPTPDASRVLRVEVGGPRCRQPYSASVFNISAMSFGSLGANALMAMNKGAKHGGFAHDTGEGGISRYHRKWGGDLIWEIGSGYFGCRDSHGDFDPARFSEQAAAPQVKMIELKLSQGAKPGHGGLLPGTKVTPEIAEARGVPVGADCVSPPAHSAFSSPVTLLEFLERLRELSGGKPVGFKLCVGDPLEFLGICKAMLETDLCPDFIVIDGAEGGTGAAPIELTNWVGTPLRDALSFVHDALTGVSLRERIKLGAGGKLITGFDLAIAIALGADWINSARGFMFATGCIQSQRCHTNECPVGVATQDAGLQRGLDVDDKAERVYHFHLHVVEALAEVTAAAGLDDPWCLRRHHFYQRFGPGEVRTVDRVYPTLKPGDLLAGRVEPDLARAWSNASAHRFGLSSAR